MRFKRFKKRETKAFVNANRKTPEDSGSVRARVVAGGPETGIVNGGGGLRS